MAIGKFELKKAAKGKWMFNLKASNGEIVLTSVSIKPRLPTSERGRPVISSLKRPSWKQRVSQLIITSRELVSSP